MEYLVKKKLRTLYQDEFEKAGILDWVKEQPGFSESFNYIVGETHNGAFRLYKSDGHYGYMDASLEDAPDDVVEKILRFLENSQ